MFSCLQILEAFLWFVLITLLNVTLIILTLSVSRLLNLLLRLVAFLLFLNPQCLASISRWITASSSWKRFCLFVCRALSSIMVICMLTAIRLLLTQSAAFSSGKVRPNHETNINIIARRTGKDVNSHTVLDGIITTIMATIQRINIIGSREGSRNRRRLKANQTGKKFRVGIKSNISTNRNNLISGVDRCIHLNAMKKTTMTSINRQTIKI